jgi:microtubule-associated protein, RP/EB family
VAGGAAAGSAKTRELETTVQELKLQNDTLDKERDFYFTKLRDIEMLLQGRPMEAGPGNDLSQDILKILYAAEDERVEVSASGELTITAPNGEQVSGEISTGAAQQIAEPENQEMASEEME